MKAHKKGIGKDDLPLYKMSHGDEELLMDIQKTKTAMDNAFNNFQNVIEPDLIDYYIYELQAMQKRYAYLLGLARTKNIRGDIKGA